MASRDHYYGWVWIGRDTPESVKFGYAYQDPMAGLTVRAVVENAWKRPLEELVAEAKSTQFYGAKTQLYRLGASPFESLGQKHFPEEMASHAPDSMARSVSMLESDIESGRARGYMIAFVPDVLYDRYGLPDQPEWMESYASQREPVQTDIPSSHHPTEPHDELDEPDMFTLAKRRSAKRLQIIAIALLALSALPCLLKPTHRELVLGALAGMVSGIILLAIAQIKLGKLR